MPLGHLSPVHSVTGNQVCRTVAAPLDSPLRHIVVSVCMQTLASQGVGGFYQGFSPAFVRSLPANATAFLVYEVAKSAMTKQH